MEVLASIALTIFLIAMLEMSFRLNIDPGPRKDWRYTALLRFGELAILVLWVAHIVRFVRQA